MNDPTKIKRKPNLNYEDPDLLELIECRLRRAKLRELCDFERKEQQRKFVREINAKYYGEPKITVGGTIAHRGRKNEIKLAVVKLLRETDLSFDEIAKIVRERFNSQTNRNCVSWYESKLKIRSGRTVYKPAGQSAQVVRKPRLATPIPQPQEVAHAPKRKPRLVSIDDEPEGSNEQ